MPGRLERFSSKPKKIPKRYWDGPGVYYHRGNNVYSKYSPRRDLRRGSRKTIGRGRYKHTNDSKRR